MIFFRQYEKLYSNNPNAMTFKIKGNYEPIVKVIKSMPKWKGLIIFYYRTDVDDENYLTTDNFSVIDVISTQFELNIASEPDVALNQNFKLIK